MKGQGIYDAALRMIAELGGEGCSDDYAERAPYLLAAFCCENAVADIHYRAAHGYPAQEDFSRVFIELGEAFPLCERFAYPAECYLASMLLMEESEALSDKLYDRYCDSISAVYGELPAQSDGIVDRYPM